MLIGRLFRFNPARKQLEGTTERAIQLPAGTNLTLRKVSDQEYHLIAVLPLKRATKAVQKAFVQTFILPEEDGK